MLSSKSPLRLVVVGAFAAVLALASACNKDIVVPNNGANDAPDPVAINSSLVAVIDGDSFISSNILVELNDTSLLINAGNQAGAVIRINVNISDPEPGIYTIDGLEGHDANYLPAGGNLYVADGPTNGGQIRITSVDTANRIIGGAFFFSGINSTGERKSVNSGKFTLQYTVRKSPPPTVNDSVFSTNPLRANNQMSAVVISATDTDTVAFSSVKSFQYLNNLYLEGTNNRHKISLILDPDQNVATVAIDGSGSFNSGYYQNQTNNNKFPVESGTVDVTRNDTLLRRISGTFEFSAKRVNTTPADSRTISNGSFDIYY